ncbi:hypothetical protein [Ensifer canadensis]
MYPLLDHDDFTKSRKALMATAAFLLLVDHLQIVGESVAIAGLTFKLDKNAVIGFGSLFLLYFAYVFIVRAIEQSMSARLAEVREEIDRLIRDVRGVIEAEALSIKRIEFENRIGGTLDKLKETTRLLSRFTLLSVEVGPPLLLALYTAYAVGAPSAIASFIRVS